jgi:hypothetical protein
VGLERWSDYIPVKLVQGGPENSYSGTIDVAVIPSLTAQTQAWKEYIPVYVDDAGTDAWTVNAVGYIPYNYALFTDSSMQLDLTNGGELDPRVTFTRTSNATVTDSTGTLVYAPHNLLTFSESFDNSFWVKTSVTVSANTSVAPDGTTTAETLTASAGASAHDVAPPFNEGNMQQGLVYSTSVFAKKGTNNFLQICFLNQTDEFANFDLDAGTVGTTGGATMSASITSVGSGWFRCVAVITPASAAGSKRASFSMVPSASATRRESWTANGTETIFIWGAQLNVGSLQPYYPTTRKNLLGFTQEFDNAAWTKLRSSITANVTTAPDNTTTADKLVEDTTASNTHQIDSATASGTLSTTHVASFYIKAAERTRARTVILFGGSNGVFVDANLADGTIGAATAFNTATAGTATITPVGNAWYRITVSGSSSASTSITTRVEILDASGNRSYTGDGTSGIFIWGAQLSDSASLDPYVYNPGAAPASTAYYGPRFDYDPVTLAPKGLLIEEQRTNLCLQSQAISTSPWVPNSFETCVPSTLVDPAGGLNAFKINLGASTFERWQQSITVVSGTTYTLSAWVRTTSGTTSFRLRFAAGVQSPDLVATTTWQRFTYTLTAATTAGFFAFLAPTTGAATEIHVYGAQLEAGAFPTSYIPTTTAAATRAADVAVMQGANFSNWYNAVNGTLFVEFTPVGAFTNARVAASLNDGSTANFMYVGTRNGSATYGTNNRVAAGAITTIGSFGAANTSQQKAAFAFDGAGQAATFNSAAVATATEAVPGVSQLNMGGVTSVTVATYISRIAYYPRKLSSSELQGITA